jgi:hypothetical protein
MSMRRRLEIEQLGDRIVPSVVPLPVSPTFSAPALRAADQRTLVGFGHGSYTANSQFADTGVHYDIQGVADISFLGYVTVNGSLNRLGFLTQGRASGTLTFTNSSGKVTLQLEGPVQSGFAALPQDFTYTVVSGTGAYMHLTDAGRLKLILYPVISPFASGAFAVSRGTFAFSLIDSRATSGIIDGVALIGPISPVSRPGVPNVRPLAGAVISIETFDGTRELARVTTDQHGTFHVTLPPGRYRIVPVPSQAVFPRGATQTVIVSPGQFTNVIVNYDSGIR